ncbi:hypothetical protein CI238_08792 [Colletotrichum incanum]|uniref:Uncharacterized protein n=1 Tax=Colletotrichum incanum TaxID=1573173 RepID=A0A167AFA4_COLIC|nr:hypothetical protein CI238_08792 [Colletotrichum incanum]
MDPLSISASVIAHVPASLAVRGKGVKLIAPLQHVLAELCDLVDELTTLQVLLITTFCMIASATLSLERDLEIIAEELHALCQ